MTDAAEESPGLAPLDSLSVGIVVERRSVEDKWTNHITEVVGVIIGAAPTSEWRLLVRGEGWERYHAATLDLELYKDEAEGYRANLGTDQPKLYIVTRRDESGAADDRQFFRVTACPYTAAKFMDMGDDAVEVVPMPDEIAAWVDRFAEQHYVARPFVKRQRQPHDPRKQGAGRPPRSGGNA